MNEMMRKKQKQKDGHKDPLLAANNRLQADVASEIEGLRKSILANENVLKDAGVLDEEVSQGHILTHRYDKVRRK